MSKPIAMIVGKSSTKGFTLSPWQIKHSTVDFWKTSYKTASGARHWITYYEDIFGIKGNFEIPSDSKIHVTDLKYPVRVNKFIMNKFIDTLK
jgi:hypothetical protein